MFLGILSAIRTKLLKIFIELDREFGCLDNLDIETNDRKLEEINNKLNVIIYEDNSKFVLFAWIIKWIVVI